LDYDPAFYAGIMPVRVAISSNPQQQFCWCIRLDYRLKPIGKTCAATGDELVPGSPCFSSLVEQDGHYLRLDFSAGGWNGPPDGEVGHWQCIVPEPEQEKAKPLDPDALMQYFEQLCEDANPAQEKFAYVLSLLLLQKRRLRIEGSRRDGEIEYLQLAGSHGEGMFEVRDQHFSDDEIDQMQQNLDTQLATEWG